MRDRAPNGLFVLCGGGVSKASEPAPLAGSFAGRPVAGIASSETWASDPELVRCWFDEQRIALTPAMPNPAHEALARLQHALSVRRCVLATWTLDGLLQKASAEEVIELHGSIFRLRCSVDPSHPRIGVYGLQPRGKRCTCGAPLRPDVRWAGEPPLMMDRVAREVNRADVFLSVGADGPLVGELLALAVARGARTIEVNPEPSGEAFDEVLREPAEVVIPCLIGRWLGEE